MSQTQGHLHFFRGKKAEGTKSQVEKTHVEKCDHGTANKETRACSMSRKGIITAYALHLHEGSDFSGSRHSPPQGDIFCGFYPSHSDAVSYRESTAETTPGAKNVVEPGKALPGMGRGVDLLRAGDLHRNLRHLIYG